MSKKTLALIVFLLIITGSLLVIALSADNKQISYVPRNEGPTPTPFAQTSLSFAPNPLTLSATNSGSVDIVITTGNNEVTAIQLELAYDPTVLSNVVINPGPFLPNAGALTPLNNTDTKNGRVNYALAMQPNSTPVKGQGVVATVTFRKLATTTATQTTLKILPKSLVSAAGETKSVLKDTNAQTTITFQ